MASKRTGSGAMSKKGARKAAREMDDLLGLSGSSPEVVKAKKPATTAAAAGNAKKSGKAGGLSAAADNEFYKNLSKFGAPDLSDDSDLDSSLDNIASSRKPTTKVDSDEDSFDNGLFGGSGKNSSAKTGPATKSASSESAPKKLPMRPVEKDENQFDFGSDDDDFSLDDVTTPVKQPTAPRRPVASESKVKDDPPKAKPAASSGKENVDSDDDSLLNFSSNKRKTGGANKSDGTNSLLGKKASSEADTPGKRSLGGFALKLGSVDLDPEQSVPTGRVPRGSEDSRSGYAPSASSGGNYAPSLSQGGGGGGGGGGGYMPSGAGQARAGRRASDDARERPSTAPGSQSKQVRINDPKDGGDGRPASVPAKPVKRPDTDASALGLAEDDGEDTRPRTSRGRSSSTSSSTSGDVGQPQGYAPSGRGAGRSQQQQGPPSNSGGMGMSGARGGSDLFASAAPAPSSTLAKSQALLSGRKESAAAVEQRSEAQTPKATSPPPVLVDHDARGAGSERARPATGTSRSSQDMPLHASPAVGAQELAALKAENDVLQRKVDELSTQVSILHGDKSRMVRERESVDGELAAKTRQIEALLHEKSQAEAVSSRLQQELGTVKVDISSSKAVLAAAEAAKGTMEQQLESLRGQLSEHRRETENERQGSVAKQTALESENSRLAVECRQLTSSLSNAKADTSKEIDSVRETFRKREENERELRQHQEARLREEMTQQAERHKSLLKVAHEELDTSRQMSQQRLKELASAHEKELNHLRQECDRTMAMKEEKNEQHVAQLQASHEKELQHTLQMTGQFTSLQGLISKVESSTMSLGQMQTEVQSHNDKSLQRREEMIKFKETQLNEIHDKLLKRETRLEDEHVKWEERVAKANLQQKSQVRELEQIRWQLQQREARVTALRKAVDEEQHVTHAKIQSHASEYDLAKEKLLKEHHNLVQECLEERRTLATERAEVATQRQEVALQVETFQARSEETRSEVDNAVAIAEKKEKDLHSLKATLKQQKVDLKRQSTKLSARRERIVGEEQAQMEMAQRLQRSTRELEHMKQEFIASKQRDDQAARATQLKHSEYMQVIADMQAQSDTLNQQNRLLQRERQKLKQKATELSSTCASCLHQQRSASLSAGVPAHQSAAPAFGARLEPDPPRASARHRAHHQPAAPTPRAQLDPDVPAAAAAPQTKRRAAAQVPTTAGALIQAPDNGMAAFGVGPEETGVDEMTGGTGCNSDLEPHARTTHRRSASLHLSQLDRAQAPGRRRGASTAARATRRGEEDSDEERLRALLDRFNEADARRNERIAEQEQSLKEFDEAFADEEQYLADLMVDYENRGERTTTTWR